MLKQLFILFIILILAGCTKYPQGNQREVSSIIATKIEGQAEWYGGPPDEQIQASIYCLLADVLTPEAAIQIAFLKNPQVQSIFEEVGIAHADLVEAGLFTNPAFELEVRYPHVKNFKTNIEYLVTAAFLDILLIPLRTRLATVELEQAKRRVAHAILDLAFDVRQTYYELVSMQQRHQYTLSMVELANLQSEIILRQHMVGNINNLAFQQAQASYLEAKLEIAKEQTAIIRLREKLNRLMGLGEDVCLILPKEIPPDVDYQGFDLCILEAVALSERLDLQAARYEVVRLQRMLGLKEGWTYTNLKAGLAGEREPDGLNVVGYGLAGEIPIFNFGQAAQMRLWAQLRQAQDRLTALEISILSEVREAHQLLMCDLEMIRDYRVGILPLQTEILKASEGLYNVMGLGIDRLLDNKHQQLEANRNYLEILKDYWVARVQLDKALGGYLFRLLPPDVSCNGGIE